MSAVQHDSSALSRVVADKISASDEALRVAYDARPSSYPANSQPPGGAPRVDDLTALRKRLLYRSKQRGWLEVDLLLGSWAEANLRSLGPSELDAYERILNIETVDLFNFLQGMKPLPSHLAADPLMLSIVAYIKQHPIGKASPAAYADVKRAMSN